MALSKKVEEWLAGQPKEVQDALRPVAEKHPEVAEGWLTQRVEGELRQADYDRQMNAGKETVRVATEERDKWKKWADTNVPKIEDQNKQWDAREQALKDAQAETERLKTQVAAAAHSAGNGNGTPADAAAIEAQIMGRIEGLKYVTAAELARIAGEEAKKLVDSQIAAQVAHFDKNVIPGVIEFTLSAQEVGFKHFKEFGEVLDREKLAAFMTENHISEPKKAYEQYIAPRRLEITMKAEVDRQVAAELAKRNTPGSPMGTPMEAGPLTLRIQNQDPLAGKEVVLGDQQASSAAAAALREAGKF